MSLQTQEATSKQQKYQEVLKIAEKRRREASDWITFFREVLGVDGVVRKAFANYDDLAEFERSDEFEEIQQMLVKLREQRIAADAETEPTRVITVRLPKSMHEYLRTEAHDLHTSMNKLCISKLLQVIDEDKIPNDRGGNSKAPQASSNHVGNRTPGSTLPRPAAAPKAAQQTPPPFKSTEPRF